MKKFLFRIAALFVSVCLILSANIYSSDLLSVGALRDDLPDAEVYGYCIIPDGTKTIPDGRYSEKNFDYLVLNEDLESIGSEAFVNNWFFVSVYIPASVKSIGEKAFGYDSTGFKWDNFKIFGQSGTEAERYANANGFRFITVNCDDSSGENILTIDDSITPSFTYNKTFDKVIVNPGASVYSGDFTYSVVKNIVLNEDDSDKKITFYGDAFADTEIETIYVPKNVQFKMYDSCISQNTFSGCKNLKTAYVAGNISYGMFTGCTSLKEVYFTPDNIANEVDDHAFDGCTALEKVDFSRSRKTGMNIGYYAFQDCKNLKELILDEDMTCYASLSDAVNLEKYIIYGKPEVSFSIIDSSYSSNATLYTSRRFFKSETSFADYVISKSEPMYTISEVNYTPNYGSFNEYSFTVDGRADKIQVIEETGATRTFNRNASNVSIVSYANRYTQVNDTSRELTYEVWTVRTRLTPGTNLQVHSKYGFEWSKYNFKFAVQNFYSDPTFKSAEIYPKENSNEAFCRIITGLGVSKIQIVYDDGSTSTMNTSAAALNMSIEAFVYEFNIKAHHKGINKYKIYYKTPAEGWKYATTLTHKI